MDKLFRAVPKHEWPDKSGVRACQGPGCGRGFSLLTKSSNCHGCGMVMCSQCLERKLTLPGSPGATPVPLCHACAVSVSTAQAELEKAYLERNGLLQMLQEHQAEAEKLLGLSSSLRSENEELLELTKNLREENDQLRMDKDVLKFSMVSPFHHTAKGELMPPLDTTESCGEKNNTNTTTNTNTNTTAENEIARAPTAEEKTLGEQLRKKQKMLDVRDATLQEALKKVLTDAAHVAAQRAQLLEDEKSLRKQLLREFDAVIVEETQRLQDVHLEELAAIGKQFAEWQSDAKIAAEESRSSDVVAVLKREHAMHIAKLEDTHQARVAETERATKSACNSHWKEEAKREKRLNEDLLVLQNALNAVQRKLVEERERCAAAESAVNELSGKLQDERRMHTEACTELREKLEKMQLLADVAKQCSNHDAASHGDYTTSVALEETAAIRTTTGVEVSQQLGSDHIMRTMCSVLSEWRCVADVLLSHHCASLSLITQATSTLFHLSTRMPSVSMLDVAVVGGDDRAKTIEKLSCEQDDSRHLSKEAENQASEDAQKIGHLKRGMADMTEELQQLREKLSRTEKALVRASRFERRLAQLEKQQQQQQQESCVSVEGGDGYGCHCWNTSAHAFIARMVGCVSVYSDACTRIVGDALLVHYDAGVLALQKEWEIRSMLTRRNAVALEHTTASIKAFQEDLMQREVLLKRAEEALRAREREVCIRHGRLLKVSMALQTVAARLREPNVSEWGSNFSNTGLF